MKIIRIDGKEYQVEDQVADFSLQTSKRAETAEQLLSELYSALGVDSQDKALATVAGLKEKSAKVDELTAAMAKVEAEKKAAAITTLLDEASRDGRLTPANREKLVGDGAPAFAKDPESLKIYLEMLPKHPAATKPSEPPPAASTPEKDDPTEGGKKGWADLTFTQKHDLFLTDHDLYVKLKAEFEQKQGGK